MNGLVSELSRFQAHDSVPASAHVQEGCARLRVIALLNVAQNNRAKLHHNLHYSSDNKAAMNTGGL